MTIHICIGSACHLRGSYSVIQALKALLEEEDPEGRITVKSSFCMGACSGGVSVRIDEQPVQSITPEDVPDFFRRAVRESLAK